MAMSLKLAGAIITIILGTTGIITTGYKLFIWLDDIYVDSEELADIINKQNVILGTINDNVVSLGLAIYDRKISEINTLIEQVESIENPNEQERIFLDILKEQLLNVKRKRLELINMRIETE